MNRESPSFQTHAKAAIDSGRPLFWKMESVQDSSLKSLAFQVSSVLDMIDRSDLKKNFIYCLNELSVNAQKAMVKRLYFIDKAMDIENPDHYQTAIPYFRDSWAKNLPEWEKRLKEANRSFQVALICKEGFITLHAYPVASA